MPITFQNAITPASQPAWYAKLLDWATSLKLKTTAWQPGGITRTIFAVMSYAFNYTDQLVSDANAAAFLDPAAAVTPEFGPGPLDLVAYYVFGVLREPATYGTTQIDFTNTGASIGPFPVGSYHVRMTSTGHTYKNQNVFTIAPGSTPGVVFVADVAGQTDGNGSTVAAITTYAGVSLSTTTGAAVGSPAETNASLVTRCKLKRGALGPKLGPLSSYEYFSLTTHDENGNPLPDYPLPNSPITRVRVFSDVITGTLTTYIANAGGAPGGGDVAAMQTYLDEVALPDGDENTVLAAATTPVTFTIDVWCPASYAPQLTSDVTAAITAFISTYPIGGKQLEVLTPSFGLSFDEFEDYLARAVPYIRTQSTLLNGSAASVSLATNAIATRSTIIVTRQGA